VSDGGSVWVRANTAGSVPVEITANDPESGVARNVAAVTGSGWSTSWVGNSADGAMRLYFGTQSAAGRLTVSSVNGAGAAGPATSVTLMRDGTAPSAPSWISAPAYATLHIRGSYFRLNWAASSDTGSGLVSQMIVGRYRAPLNSDGTCKTNGFVADGGFGLASANSWDSGLVANACYVWSLRAVDNVGNMSASVVSGYVITDRR
jgi:hypothetical protein